MKFKSKRNLVFQVMLLLIALLATIYLSPMAFSDEDFGLIQGTVEDESDQPIIGAKIETDTGISTTSYDNGFYVMAVPPGTYTVTASEPDYQSQTVSDVTVSNAETVTLDFTLPPRGLKLDAVYPTLGRFGESKDVTLTGAGFDANTRVSMTLDVGNQDSIIGHVDMPRYSAQDVVVVGDIAYVAADYDGLQVVDVSIPESPVIIGSVNPPGIARGIAVAGSTAYVAAGWGLNGSGLSTIDVSNPENPVIIGTTEPIDGAWDVAVAGNYAYVAARDAGLLVIDINPTSGNYLKIIDSVVTSDLASGVAVEGSIALVANHASGLQLFDITIPQAPTFLEEANTPGLALDVAVAGDTAYVADYDTLQVVNITDPANPDVAGSVLTPGGAGGVVAAGDTAYVSGGSGGLNVIDVSNPVTPVIIGSVNAPGIAKKVAVAGTTAFLSSSVGLHVIDVSDPQIQGILGSLAMKYQAEDVVVVEDIAYVADTYFGLRVVDVSNPENPVIIGSVEPPYCMVFGLAVEGDFAYLADHDERHDPSQQLNATFHVIDVRDPRNPSLVSSLDVQDETRDVAIRGQYAFVVGEAGLRVVDVSSPANPSVIGSVDTPSGAFNKGYAVAVAGDFAYVADVDKGLTVIKVQDPTKPEHITSVDTQGWVMDVVVAGDFAYVANHNSGLVVIDISPSNYLDPIGSVDTDGSASGVTVVGNTAYVADLHDGVHVIDVTYPQEPVIIGSVDTTDAATATAVKGDVAFVADQDGGLVIVPLPIEITVDDDKINEKSMPVTLPSPTLPGDYTLRVFDSSRSDELHGGFTFTEYLRMLDSKAIIVAGSGPGFPSTEIWTQTKLSANTAYDVLILQGYDHDTINYLSMETGNEYVDSASLDIFLSDAIRNWASDASELLIYLVGHGDPENFVIYADGDYSQTVSAQQLDGWLDDLQSGSMTGPIAVIYDACQSGTFVSRLLPPAERNRIVMTSADNEPAVFPTEDTSFSYQFWNEIIAAEGNLGYSFSRAKIAMQFHQTAQLDADNNGKALEDNDFSLANSAILRRGAPVSLSARPAVGKTWVGDPTLNPATSTTIFASDVSNADSVWAQIIPPDVDPDQSGVPISALPVVPLTDPEPKDGVYEGVYAGFDTMGSYIIIVKASAREEVFSYVLGEKTTLDFYSSPVHTSVVQTAGAENVTPDEYEVDDTFGQANVITLNGDIAQHHNFHVVGDADWVKFYGISGQLYEILASSLSVICDVVIEVYDSNGTTQLKRSPDPHAGAGEDELLDFTPTKDGIYYVKLTNVNANLGENVRYNLKIYRPIAPLHGFITGVVTDAGSGVAIGGAKITTDNNASAISLPEGGEYLMVVPAAGSVIVTVEAPGYISKSYSTSIDEGGTTHRDVALVSIAGDSGVVATIDSPPASIAINPGQSVDFQGSVTGGNAPFTCSWDFGGGAINAEQEDPGSVTFQDEGIYSVTFTVTDDDGDTSSDSISVTVSPEGSGSQATDTGGGGKATGG